MPALVVLLVYGAILIGYLASGHDARDFIRIGRRFVLRSHASAVIQYDPHYAYMADNTGNDGQFAYYLALDPANARYYMDYPSYRYTRITYPLAARALAFGQAGLIPYTLLLVNLLAAAGGTLALAAWLYRRSCSPWLALLFGFYPGVAVVLQRDLTEVLAYALVALAVYLFDFGGRWAPLWAGLAFAAATLSRETAALFPIVYGLALLLRAPATEIAPAGMLKDGGTTASRIRMSAGRWATAALRRVRANWRRAALLLATALAPFAAYKLFLFAWLGDFGTRPDLAPHLVPFSGLFFLWPWQYQQIVVVVAVIVPALICAGMALWALARRAWTVEIWSLLLNIQVLVVMLAPTSYFIYSGTGRITTGVIVAVLLAVPTFDALTGGNRGWLIACAAWWLLGIPAVTAVALLLHVPLRDVSVGGVALAVALPLPMLRWRRRIGASLYGRASVAGTAKGADSASSSRKLSSSRNMSASSAGRRRKSASSPAAARACASAARPSASRIAASARGRM
jgi:hypothetical protein